MMKEMRSIRIKQIDTFTTVPHAGNSAGVVLNGGNLTEQQMRSIARELNLTETAFVFPASKPGADFKVQWFTPTKELPLNGHAMIATLHALAEESMFDMKKDGEYDLKLETSWGTIPVELRKREGKIVAMIQLKPPVLEKATQFKVDLVRLLNVTISEFDASLPIQRSGFLFVPFRRLHTVFNLIPNYSAMAMFLPSRKLDGICVFSLETIDRDSFVHVRFFAPNLGIQEDPVTAAVHAHLAMYLHERGLLKVEDGRCVFQAEQGDAMGRRGRIKVELQLDGEKLVSIKIGGPAVTVLEGEMKLPE